jgi:hypothetical protein
MSTHSVTLQLPESLIRRAKQVAIALDHPLEEVLTATLSAALPDLEDVPAPMQAELARMISLNDEALWEIAQRTLSAAEQRQMQQLIDHQSERDLTPAEVQQLEALRHQYGRITLQKARAFALLSSRNGRPLLVNS